ncbi:MAG: hypothetical protein ACREDR_11555 [Blastocatellia bacterium]
MSDDVRKPEAFGTGDVNRVIDEEAEGLADGLSLFKVDLLNLLYADG